jgi:hypothetical protein
MKPTISTIALLCLVAIAPAMAQPDCSQLQIVSTTVNYGCSVTSPPFQF